jgi:hypothetical protein
MRNFTVFVVFLLTACGAAPDDAASDQLPDVTKQQAEEKSIDDVTNEKSSSTLYVKEGEEIPACDEESQLIYVQAEKTFKTCVSGAWVNIDIQGQQGVQGIQGEKGDQGVVGEKGSKGEDGKDGTDNRIVSRLNCNKDITTHTGTYSIVAAVTYNYAKTASGDVFVSAAIISTSSEDGASNFYASEQTGATKGSVTITSDKVGVADVGYWTFEKTGDTQVKVEYRDTAVPNDRVTWTLNAASCVAATYN